LTEEGEVDGVADNLKGVNAFSTFNEGNDAGEDRGEVGVIKSRWAVVEETEKPVPSFVFVGLNLAVDQVWELRERILRTA